MQDDKTPKEDDKDADRAATGLESKEEAVTYRAVEATRAEEGRVEAEQAEEVTEDRRA